MAVNETTKTVKTKQKTSWFSRLVLAVIFIVALLMAIIYFLLATEQGLNSALRLIPKSVGVEFKQVSGTLLSGKINIAELNFQHQQKKIELKNIQLQWQPYDLWAHKLNISKLDIERLTLLLPSDGKPIELPESLQLPLALELGSLNIAQLSYRTQTDQENGWLLSEVKLSAFADQKGYLIRQLALSSEYGQISLSGDVGANKPFPLDINAKLEGQVKLLEHQESNAVIDLSLTGNVPEIVLSAQASGLNLNGTVDALLQPLAAFPLAKLKMQIDGFNPQDFKADAPQALLSLQTDLQGNNQQQLFGAISISNQQAGRYDNQHIPVEKIQANTLLTLEQLEFTDIDAHLYQSGSLTGTLIWFPKQFGGKANLLIKELNPASLDSRAQPMVLNGTLLVDGDSTQQVGNIKLSDGTVKLQADFSQQQQKLIVSKIILERNKALLQGQGSFVISQPNDFDFSGSLAHFNVADFVDFSATDLNASLNLSGKLKPDLMGNLQFDIQPSQVFEQTLTGSGQLDFKGVEEIAGKVAIAVGQNQVNAEGVYKPTSPQVKLVLQAPQLKQLGLDLTGALSGHAELNGTNVSWDMIGEDISWQQKHHIVSVKTQGQLQGDHVTGSLNLKNYQQDKQLLLQSLDATLLGKRAQHEFVAQAEFLQEHQLQLKAQGGLSGEDQGWDKTHWQGEIRELIHKGTIPFQLNTPAELSLSRALVKLQQATFNIAGGKLNIASLLWQAEHGLQTRGNLTGIGLRTAGIPQLTQGGEEATLRLGGDWDISSLLPLVGKASIKRESGDWVITPDSPFALQLEKMLLNLDADGRQLRVTGEVLGERLGQLNANFNLPLSAKQFPDLNTSVTGKIKLNSDDLRWIGPIVSDNIRSAGQLALDMSISGNLAQPKIQGQLVGDNLEIILLDQAVRLQQGQLRVAVDEHQVTVQSLSFKAPHGKPPKDNLLRDYVHTQQFGTLAASGSAALDGNSGEIEIKVDHLPLSQTAHQWIIVSGQGGLKLDEKHLSVTGKILADVGLIKYEKNSRPSLSDDIVFSNQPEARKKKQPIYLDASLDFGKNFYLRAAGLESRLVGELSLRGSPGQQLRAVGMISTQDANFEAYGQRLAVERGIVNFQGPLNDPGLNILAVRKGLTVEAGVQVTGTVLHPEIALVSTPSVPDAEKLSWIVLGRVPEASGVDAALLLAAANSILGQGSSGITSQIKDTLGIDEFTLRQAKDGELANSDGNQDNILSTQIISIGKRLSSRAFLSYEQGVTAVAGVTKLTYNLTPRINIVTQAGYDNAIDVFYTFRFE